MAELKRQRRLFPPAVAMQPRLALEAGIEQYLAGARWARKALTLVQESRR